MVHFREQDMLNPGLRYFVAVARHGSFRGAAEELHVAQSALSRQILKLEADFGMPLFERRARGVQLTAAGTIFLRHARSCLQQVDDVRSELEALNGLRRGVVNIQSIESLVQHLLPRAISRFSQQHPGITFDVTIDATDHVLAAVREGRTDIGLVFYPPRERELRTVFKSGEPLVALMSASHPLARRGRVSLANAMLYPIALPVRNSGSRMLIDAACKAAGIYLTPVLETNSVQLLVHFAHENMGITFQSRLSAWDSLRTGDLVAVPIRDRLVNSGTIDAVTLASRQLPKAAEAFLRFLHGELRSLSEAARQGLSTPAAAD
jgi:DNA-binding transcriptional LysR family regulator